MRAGALLLVACGSTTPAPTIGSRTAPPPARATPAPSIAFAADHFQLYGLPAIARDRTRVILAITSNDAGRPSLRIEARDFLNGRLESDDVLTANDYERLVINGNPTAELAKHIDSTNRRLVATHQRHDLIPMLAASSDSRSELVAGDATIAYRDSTLTITRLGKPPVTLDEREWQAPHGARVPGGPPCENPGFMKTVYWAPNLDAIVVEIAYNDMDTCWAFPNQLHVIQI